MSEHIRKLHDTNKPIDVTLSPSAVDLTGSTCKLIVTQGPGKTSVFVRTATISQATNPPKVSTSVLSTDFPAPGTYQAEVEVTFPNGKVQTFPEEGYLAIRVVQDLG